MGGIGMLIFLGFFLPLASAENITDPCADVNNPCTGFNVTCTNVTNTAVCDCDTGYQHTDSDFACTEIIAIPCDDFICAIRRPFQSLRGRRAKLIRIYSIHDGVQHQIVKLSADENQMSSSTKSLLLPVTDKEDRFGAFRCSANILGKNISIVAITQEKNRLYNQIVTKTLDIGERLMLEPMIGSVSDLRLRWKFNGKDLNRFRKMKMLEKTVQLDDEGIYETFPVRRYKSPHAVMQVYVQEGADCSDNCTQNDGKCDADGKCRCPPGRFGEYCDNECWNGWFGSDCQYKCSAEFGEPFLECDQVLFCFGKPLGCLCYKDFSPPNCK